VAIESEPLFHPDAMGQQVLPFTLGNCDYRPVCEVAESAEGTAVRLVIDVDILGHVFERSKTRENCRLPSCLSPANIAACLVSSKTNPPSPAQR
jgi:hypothetical protein